jgi:hypothetical protein
MVVSFIVVQFNNGVPVDFVAYSDSQTSINPP